MPKLTRTQTVEQRTDSIPAAQNSELNLIELLDNLFDPNTKVMYDLRVDDRDFKEAPNLHTFCTSPKGLNVPLWPRQTWMTSELLNEICPTCSKYKCLTDVPKDVDADEFARNTQFLHYGVCPKCKKTRLDLLRAGKIQPYSELAGLAGQRIGKSFMAAVLMAYSTHRFLKLQDPSKVYGVLPTTFMGTMVGLTFDKAVSQLWLPYKGLIDSSPWFQSYLEMLKSRELELGKQLLKYNNQSIHFLHRGLLVHPAGPNRKTLRGNTRIFASIDEFDFFDTDEANDSVKMNGVEVYKSLTNSLFTARIGWRDAVKRGMYSLMNAYQFNISSPQSMNSPLSSIVLTNPDTKRVYAVHLATWEVHPKVSEADIRREFSDDPAKADRDFGAIPPRSSNPFLSLEIAEGMPSQTMQNAVSLQYIHGKTPSGELRRAAKITNIRKLAVEQPSVLSIDAGFSNNSFSFSVGHVEIRGKNRVIVHTALGEIMPEKGISTLDYNKIASEVLYPIIRDLNVRFVLADRWNSLKLLHDIEAEFKIPTLVYSIKYPDFHLVKSYMEAGAVIVPKRETKRDVFKYDKYPEDFIDRPVDHFCLQAATVVDTKKTISKGEKLTDDIWRALALGTVMLLDEEFCEKFLKVVKHNKFKGAIAYTGGISLTGTGLHNVSGAPKKLIGVSASNMRF